MDNRILKQDHRGGNTQPGFDAGTKCFLQPFNFLKLGKNAAGIIIQVLAYGRYFNSVIISD